MIRQSVANCLDSVGSMILRLSERLTDWRQPAGTAYSSCEWVARLKECVERLLVGEIDPGAHRAGNPRQVWCLARPVPPRQSFCQELGDDFAHGAAFLLLQRPDLPQDGGVDIQCGAWHDG